MPNFSDNYDPFAGRFAVVLPLVNPQKSGLGSYDTVEQIMRQTLTSLTAMRGVQVHVFVVCHRVPDWAEHFASSVSFVDVDHQPAFAPNRNKTRPDKGMKYITGILAAMQSFRPDWIMLFDGDDFAHKGLIEAVIDADPAHPNSDGFILKNGIHFAIRQTESRFVIKGAFPVREFDKSCGSCRIFRASRLFKILQNVAPELTRGMAETELGPVIKPTDQAAKSLAAFCDADAKNYNGLTQTLGRHMDQDHMFQFAPLHRALAAKACGHGNHDSLRGNDVHWNRVIGVANPAKIMAEYGLNAADMDPRQDVFTNVKAWLFAGRNVVYWGARRLRKSIIR